MSEAKVDNPATTNSLEQQLDVLLDKMQSDLSEAGEQLAAGSASAADSASVNVTAEESFDQELEAELTSQTSSASMETQPAAESPQAVAAVAGENLPAAEETEPATAPAASANFATSGEEVTESLDSAVSEMMADASASLAAAENEPVSSAAPVQVPQRREAAPVAEVPGPQAGPTASTVQASSVEDLDSQLASLTEQLLSEPDDGVAMAVAAAPAAAHRVAVSSQDAHPASTLKTPEVKVTAEKAKSTASDKVAVSAAGTKLPALQAGALSPLLVRVLSPLSAPLNKYPKVVRDTLGWVSLITLFWAMTIWAYLLFFHKPVDAEIPESAPHLAGDTTQSGHDDQGKSGHENAAKSGKDHSGRVSDHEGESSAGHGEPAKKPHGTADSHAETAKTQQPHKSPDEHGSH